VCLCECVCGKMDWRPVAVVAALAVLAVCPRQATCAWQDVVRPKMFVQIGE
jgi:hypothetical protein